MTNNVTKTKLDNGITLHLKEIHTAPIISHWVWYRVGSRDEMPGKTGISHWVEHMQFKGPRNFRPASWISNFTGWRILERFHLLDWTHFLKPCRPDSINLAYQLETDRMVNSVYDPNEVDQNARL